MIHMTVKMVLEKSRNATTHCSGKSSTLLLGNRIKNRHMETLVYADLGVSMAYSKQKWDLQDNYWDSFALGIRLTTRIKFKLGKISSEMYVPT